VVTRRGRGKKINFYVESIEGKNSRKSLVIQVFRSMSSLYIGANGKLSRVL